LQVLRTTFELESCSHLLFLQQKNKTKKLLLVIMSVGEGKNDIVQETQYDDQDSEAASNPERRIIRRFCVCASRQVSLFFSLSYVFFFFFFPESFFDFVAFVPCVLNKLPFPSL
jgi:hypothetical protein